MGMNLPVYLGMYKKQHLKGLALNGGGVRGIIQVEQLVALEDALGTPLYRYFDYVSGTSVGSISAALIATGRSARQVRAIMHEEIEKIFDRPFYRLGLFRPKYSSDALIEGCKKYLNRPLDSTGKNGMPYLLVPVTNITYRDQGEIMKSTTPGVMLYDAIVASCSAGYYFPQHTINGKTYVDGGMVFNNPSDIIREQAIKHHSIGRTAPIVDIVNITTGAIDAEQTWAEKRGGIMALPVTTNTMLRGQDLKTHGKMAWVYGAKCQDEVDNGVEISPGHYDMMFKNENGSYFRLESFIRKSSGKIDDARKKNIKAMVEDGHLSAHENQLLMNLIAIS